MKKGYFETSDHAFLYYEDTEVGDTTIIFVPGHMCTTKFYAKNVEGLRKKYRVVCFDSRGFGNSSKPLQGNSIERHSDDIHELIEFLHLDNILLIGWSLSGSVVATYAHKYAEEHLIALGLLDTCLFPFSPADWNSYNSKNYNMDDWNRKYRLWYADPETYLNNFCNRVKPGLSEEAANMVREEIKKTPPWIGFALHSDWCHRDCTKYLPELTIPVIIFSGSSKGHTPSMGNYYQTLIPTYHEHHIYKEGGHMLFWIKAETFNRQIDNFMEKVLAKEK